MTSDNVSRAARLIALMEPDELAEAEQAIEARWTALELMGWGAETQPEPEQIAKPMATTKTAKGKSK